MNYTYLHRGMSSHRYPLHGMRGCPCSGMGQEQPSGGMPWWGWALLGVGVLALTGTLAKPPRIFG